MTSTQTKNDKLTKVPRNLEVNTLKEQQRQEMQGTTFKVPVKSFESVPATKTTYLTAYKNDAINVVPKEESQIKNLSTVVSKEFYKPTITKPDTTVVGKVWPVPEKKYSMIGDDEELTSNITVQDIADSNLTYAYGLANTKIELPMDKEDKYLLKGRNALELRPIPNYVPLHVSQRGGVYGMDRVKYNEEIQRKNKTSGIQ